MVSIDNATAAGLFTMLALLLPALAKIKITRKQADEFFTRTGRRWSSEDTRNILALKLAQAGLEVSSDWFVGVRLALAGGTALLLLPLVLRGTDVFLVALIVPLMYWIPSAWLNTRASARKLQIRTSLADFTIYLSTALAAGAPITLALKEAADGTGGPLAEEVEKALKENASGRSITEALSAISERCDVDELRSLTRTIIQSYRYGSPLAEAMRSYSAQMSLVRKFEMMEQANKLSVRLIFPILVFMLVPCLIIIGYPAVVSCLEAFK